MLTCCECLFRLSTSGVHVVTYNAFILFKGSDFGSTNIFFLLFCFLSLPFTSPKVFHFCNHSHIILCSLFLFFMLNHTSALPFVYSFPRLVIFKVYSKCFIPLIIIINYYYQLHINSASFALFYLSPIVYILSVCMHV